MIGNNDHEMPTGIIRVARGMNKKRMKGTPDEDEDKLKGKKIEHL